MQANISCAKEIQAKASRAQVDCMATKKNAPECIRGYNIAISSIPIICGSSKSGRKKRYKYDECSFTWLSVFYLSFANRNSHGHCVHSSNFRSCMCFTGEIFYEFGQVASEPCRPSNHGKQKCV